MVKRDRGLHLPVRIDRAIVPQPPPRSDPPSGDGNGGGEVEAFQRHVAELLLDLAGDDVLSLSWTRKLLDVFLICLEEFRVLLFNSGAQATPLPPPLDRLLADFERGLLRPRGIDRGATVWEMWESWEEVEGEGEKRR
uniref:Uncharacterized protein n=1 Tax=Ananas comosus var. bracteatus TaxID=296719 RepID=A0A6V7NI47_ANACO|nr:unnamed protein product [Ananas comosus var. bracteatus]